MSNTVLMNHLSRIMVRKGTEESSLGKDSSIPLTHHDPRDLRLICLVKNAKSVLGFENPIFDFL